MEGKSSDWVRGPSGPTVCRCCFAEGCYKDISTEYFWMGKREVYAEMLTETFDLSIAFAQTSGPNSNSRLICEPCISRLRDASEFKRQVQECEKMFMQYLDPGRIAVDSVVESTPEPMEKEVKLERVKLEKNQSDDDEFDNRSTFDDMDDDDLDDQPLTKLASKVPKKESVDLLDLLDNAKAAEKRKATTKPKATPAKKAKTKKDSPKATASKAKPEKKKKGEASNEAIQVKQEMCAAEDTKDSQWRTNLRNNVSTIVAVTTVYPFKYLVNHGGAYFLCYYCKDTFIEATELRNHNRKCHYDVKEIPRPKGYRPIKMDFTAASCKVCASEIRDYAMLKSHLAEHGKMIDTGRGDSILPYNLGSDQHVCQVCGRLFESFIRLLRHMAVHSDRHMCNQCDKRFNSYHLLMMHIRKNECIIPVPYDVSNQEGSADTPVATEDSNERRRANLRNNIRTIISMTTVYPFKYKRGAYLCYYCDTTYLDPEQLREHNRAHHSQIKLFPRPKTYEPVKMDFVNASCKVCSTPIDSYATLKSHLAEHNKEIDTTYGESVLPYDLSADKLICQICKKPYETFLSLHRHINEHYDLCICDICGKKFKTFRQLTLHRRIHERGEFSCKKCDQTFSLYSSLHTHNAKVHRKTVTYKCLVCDEKFYSNRQRLQHMTDVHNQKKPEYPCPNCDKVFDLCSKRTAHIKSLHFQERNHECNLCGMKFFTKTALRHHSVKHDREKKYQCDICKKTYARKKTLREHMRIHNNDRRFACPVCELTFIQKCSMKYHLKVHHPTQFKDEFEA